MHTKREDFKNAIWFLKHPSLYPELYRKVKKRILGPPHPDTQEEARHWCKQRAVSTREALEEITGKPSHASIQKKYGDAFAQAEKQARACPVNMGGAGNLDLLYHLTEYVEATKVVETGVAYGWSALAILMSLTERENARLISTDMPYPGRHNEQYVGCVVPEELRSNWQIIRRADREALPLAIGQFDAIDLCHYDSDKTHEGRLWAYPRLWNALRRGGCFISDDIGDNVAFRDFAASVDSDPIVVNMATDAEIGTKYIGVLMKK